MNKEIYLKTAFCCMACDGEIADEEIQLIKDYVHQSSLFDGMEVENLLNGYIDGINADGISFFHTYLRELKEASLDAEQEIQILQIAINMIEADNEIRYSEIKFFKRILACLDISDEAIEKAFPDKEDYFLPDINQEEYEFVPISAFATMKIKL